MCRTNRTNAVYAGAAVTFLRSHGVHRVTLPCSRLCCSRNELRNLDPDDVLTKRINVASRQPRDYLRSRRLRAGSIRGKLDS